MKVISITTKGKAGPINDRGDGICLGEFICNCGCITRGILQFTVETDEGVLQFDLCKGCLVDGEKKINKAILEN